LKARLPLDDTHARLFLVMRPTATATG